MKINTQKTAQLKRFSTAATLSLVLVISSVAVTLSGADAGATTNSASTYEWQQATGKQNGFTGDYSNWLDIASSDDGVKLAAIASGGYILTSTDSGQGWVKRTSAGDRFWNSISSSADGTKLIATANNWNGTTYVSSIYTSSNSGATWTERMASDNVWHATASSADGMKLVAANGVYVNNIYEGSIYTSNDAGVTWTERTGPGTRGWKSVASSSDGAKLVAVGKSWTGSAYEGAVYTSTDSGVTWTVRAGAGSSLWREVSSSADGTKLVASDESTNGNIYTSADSGATWTLRTSAGAKYWYNVASNADGTKLVAAVFNGNIYTSADSGATWTERVASGTNQWRAVASNASGTKLVAGSYAGPIITSGNSGLSWTVQTAQGSRVWASVASSADGTKLVAAETSKTAGVQIGYIYTSSDSGATWTERTSAGQRAWQSVTSNADGTKLVAVENTFVDGSYLGYLYTSSDSGATWVQRTNAGVKKWTAVTSNADGTKLVAVENNWGESGYVGSIYTSTNSGVSWTERTSAGSKDWSAVSSSADGTVILAGTWSAPQPYISRDSGVTWTTVPNLIDGAWANLAMNTTGTIMIAADSNGTDTNDGNGGYVYISRDSGITWTPLTNLSPRYWADYGGTGIAISDDGMKVAVLDTYDTVNNDWNGGYVYTSIDGGITWTEESEIGIGYWNSVAMSRDGAKLAVSSNYGNLHVYTASLFEPTLGFTPVPTQGGEEAVPLPVNSTPSEPQPITNTQPTFSGVTYPNGIITITVHSDPITCTTTADAQGNWSCTLPSTIPPGTHTINVELTNPITSEVTVLGPYYVQVAEDPVVITNTTPKAPNTGIAPKGNTTYDFVPILLAWIGAVLSLLVVSYLIQKHRAK
ncbi:MAG: Ig-like domain-containing protein [Patescibacteria group bacterium]